MGQAADELRDPEEIRADIEDTRQDMAKTLDAIGEKVSPRIQAERQVERLRESGIEPQRAALAAGALLLMLFLMRRVRARRRAD